MLGNRVRATFTFFTRREKTFASRGRCEVSVTSPSRQTTTSTLSAKRACRSRSRIAFGRLRPVPEDWSVYGKTSFKVKWWVGYLMITFPTENLLNYTQSLQSFASIDGPDRQTVGRTDRRTLDRYRDPAPHTMRVASTINELVLHGASR